jgi:predicted nucleic acid-binding protein
MDALIAATPLQYDLVLVTGNGQDFNGADLNLVNPWT